MAESNACDRQEKKRPLVFDNVDEIEPVEEGSDGNLHERQGGPTEPSKGNSSRNEIALGSSTGYSETQLRASAVGVSSPSSPHSFRRFGTNRSILPYKQEHTLGTPKSDSEGLFRLRRSIAARSGNDTFVKQPTLAGEIGTFMKRLRPRPSLTISGRGSIDSSQSGHSAFNRSAWKRRTSQHSMTKNFTDMFWRRTHMRSHITDPDAWLPEHSRCCSRKAVTPISFHEDVPPNRWCVSYHGFAKFEREVRTAFERGEIKDSEEYPNVHHNNPRIGPNIYQVNTYFIKPVTERAGSISYALMLNPAGLPCDIFVTHCWAEGVFEFCRKMKRAWPRRARHAWICFLANPQNLDLELILAGDVMESPFAMAIRSAEVMIVIPNVTTSIYTRLWCVLEAKLAVDTQIDIKLPVLSSTVPWKKAACQMLPSTIIWFCVSISYSVTKASSVFDDDEGREAKQRLKHLIMITLGGSSFTLLVLNFTAEHVIARSCAQEAVAGLVTGWLCWWANAHSGAHFFVLTVLCIVLIIVEKEFIVARLQTKIIQEEGRQLDFASVSYATCSNPHDEQRLRGAIHGQEMDIDFVINLVRKIGKYDRYVREDIEQGFDPTHGLQFNGFKFIASCFIFEYNLSNSANTLHQLVGQISWQDDGRDCWYRGYLFAFLGLMCPVVVALIVFWKPPSLRRVCFVQAVFWWVGAVVLGSDIVLAWGRRFAYITHQFSRCSHLILCGVCILVTIKILFEGMPFPSAPGEAEEQQVELQPLDSETSDMSSPLTFTTTETSARDRKPMVQVSSETEEFDTSSFPQPLVV